MSKPTKMSKKNTTPERRSVRVTALAYKRLSTEESSKKPAPEIERMVSDERLKNQSKGFKEVDKCRRREDIGSRRGKLDEVSKGEVSNAISLVSKPIFGSHITKWPVVLWLGEQAILLDDVGHVMQAR
ncbi:hypothetical protein TIFTF001_022364 [Ficus carica]|uniref:Uncharacterized protein n=1 Tax=Ficus carica TaxID=3494 RepID=A0AA88ACF0_FICCA|nr:hypothetical protein TIFTF001_022364 [Ficus carica]